MLNVSVRTLLNPPNIQEVLGLAYISVVMWRECFQWQSNADYVWIGLLDIMLNGNDELMFEVTKKHVSQGNSATHWWVLNNNSLIVFVQP